MVKKNTKHLQRNLFGMQTIIPDKHNKIEHASEEYYFYDILFCNIEEDIFSVLYSDKKSRPNASTNSLVAALILKERKKWSYSELFKNLRFNLLTRMAFGLDDLITMPFCYATLFNFQNRLNDHFVKTGENLLEHVFDHLTEKQLKALNLKTDIQRTDSTFAASNIRNYTRLQLLIEMIIRIYRILSEDDKKQFQKQFEPYINKSSGQYIYKLKASDIPHELETIAQLYFWIDKHLRPHYNTVTIFETFSRVFKEHFTVAEEKIEVKLPKELHSHCIQSPDDPDATYKEKNGKKSKGQSINVFETADPTNPINLLTDVSLHPNNKDDSKNLNSRIDILIEKTPDLNELHNDGGYGSSDNDKKFEKLKINMVQSAVRGEDAAVPFEIEDIGNDTYKISCPHQTVESLKTKKRFKAEFDLSVCNACKISHDCPAAKRKKCRTFYFTREDYLRKERLKNRNALPPERRKLRCNVEATINEFVCKMPNGKLRVRGAFKTSVFAYSTAISINFGRIFRYNRKKNALAAAAVRYFDFVKELLLKMINYSRMFNFTHAYMVTCV